MSWWKAIKYETCQAFYHFCNKFNKFSNTGAWMLDSILALCIEWNLIRLLLRESDLGSYCLQFWLSKFIGRADKVVMHMCGSRKFFRGGPTLTMLFLVDEWREDPNSTISGPSLTCQWKHHLNVISLACRWWPTLNAGLVALWFFRGSGPVLLRNPIFLCFFWGVGGVSRPPVPPPPSGSVHDVWQENRLKTNKNQFYQERESTYRKA